MTDFKAGIYIRLSEADEGKNYETESESIINQRNLLINYLKEKGFNFVSEYVDDGYSGTNFERPGFLKLISDIKSKKINLVIVKDLSRLGRDHIMTGYYVENFFPENNIRFISIQENYDSFKNQASNDSSTFIFACNDYYSRQNSIKIRSVLNDKRRQGKFIGSTPSFGYQRDPNDKGHLIIDKENARIVKKIFDMAYLGSSISQIVTYLNDNKIKTPSTLKRKNPNANNKYNPIWTISSVSKILKNQMYVGDKVQSVQTKVSYKSKKKKTLPKSNWDIIPNTHEAIVDRFIFETVQSNLKRTKVTNKNKREKRLFENLLICLECGNSLTISCKNNYYTINCNKYTRNPKLKLCQSHFIPYEKLEGDLLKKVQETYKKYLQELNLSDIIKSVEGKKDSFKEIKSLELKEREYLNKLDLLYEDRFKEVISIDIYKRLSKETEVKLDNIRSEINKLKESKPKEEIKDDTKIKTLIDIDNPTRDLIKLIINKIIIDKDRNIEIIYNFSIR